MIGGGISGLTAGYILSRTDDVTVFEAADRLGGHADTHLVRAPGGRQVPADTGFIVYNEWTYPLLTRLFAELGVTTRAAEMSMSVCCAGCGVRYAGRRGLAGLGAGLPRGDARYLRMLAEVPRFHRAARRLLASETLADLSFEEFLRAGGFSAYFTAHFAAPLVAAVWSCPPGMALRYPAGYLFAFLANHGMLSVSGSPQWRTVTGGSRRYVERIAARLSQVRLSSPVRSVRRFPGGVLVRDRGDRVLAALPRTPGRRNGGPFGVGVGAVAAGSGQAPRNRKEPTRPSTTTTRFSDSWCTPSTSPARHGSRSPSLPAARY